MDNFEKWATRFLDGCIERCDPSTPNWRRSHLRLHSGRRCCQSNLSYRLVHQQEAFEHIEHLPLHIEHIKPVQMGRRPGQNQCLFTQISTQIGRLVNTVTAAPDFHRFSIDSLVSLGTPIYDLCRAYFCSKFRQFYSTLFLRTFWTGSLESLADVRFSFDCTKMYGAH